MIVRVARLSAPLLLIAATVVAMDDAETAAPPPAKKPVVEIAPKPVPPPPPPEKLAPEGESPAARSGPTVARWSATLLTHASGGKQPSSCAIIDEGKTLLVANRGDNTVSVFDTQKLELQRTINEVGYSAWGLLPMGKTLLVANWNGSSVAMVDYESGKRTGELPAGMKPSYIATDGGNRIFTTGNFGGELVIADLKSKRELRRLDLGKRPMGLVMSPDGRWLYVAVCNSKLIARVDLKHEVVLDRFGADLAATTNLVLTPDGRQLVAAGDDGRLLMVDAETGSVVKIRVGADLSSVALSPDGRTAFVADYGNDAVAMVDLRQLEVFDRVSTGAGPIHVETDGRRLYTCNDKASTVTAFTLEALDGVAGQ